MLSYDEAYNVTDPNLGEDERKRSANRILDGVRANQIYWDSRSELEALKAQAEGHGVVVRGAEDEEGSPTAVGTGTAQQSETIEGTAEEESTTALDVGASENPGGGPVPSPENPTQAVATLRAQLRDAGIDPEA